MDNSPSPQELVTSLMSFVGKEKRNVRSKQHGQSLVKDNYMHHCPKPNCNVFISFLDKSGFKNLYEHLKSCYEKVLEHQGQEKGIIKLYTDAQNESGLEGSSILEHFKDSSLSDYDKVFHAHL